MVGDSSKVSKQIFDFSSLEPEMKEILDLREDLDFCSCIKDISESDTSRSEKLISVSKAFGEHGITVDESECDAFLREFSNSFDSLQDELSPEKLAAVVGGGSSAGEPTVTDDRAKQIIEEREKEAAKKARNSFMLFLAGVVALSASVGGLGSWGITYWRYKPAIDAYKKNKTKTE